jgi:hypothetical protein
MAFGLEADEKGSGLDAKQAGTPLPPFCVSAHSRHKRYFRNPFISRNLLNYSHFRASLMMLIMLKMLIMDESAVQTQCNLFR